VPGWLLRAQDAGTVTWLGQSLKYSVANIASQHAVSHEFADQFARDDADIPTNAGPEPGFPQVPLQQRNPHLHFALPIVMANDSNNLQ
jgi:hypothetical protein